jgi:hypothetical protein
MIFAETLDPLEVPPEPEALDVGGEAFDDELPQAVRARTAPSPTAMAA